MVAGVVEQPHYGGSWHAVGAYQRRGGCAEAFRRGFDDGWVLADREQPQATVKHGWCAAQHPQSQANGLAGCRAASLSRRSTCESPTARRPSTSTSVERLSA